MGVSRSSWHSAFAGVLSPDDGRPRFIDDRFGATTGISEASVSGEARPLDHPLWMGYGHRPLWTWC